MLGTWAALLSRVALNLVLTPLTPGSPRALHLVPSSSSGFPTLGLVSTPHVWTSARLFNDKQKSLPHLSIF